jgi:hypothetical protein
MVFASKIVPNSGNVTPGKRPGNNTRLIHTVKSRCRRNCCGALSQSTKANMASIIACGSELFSRRIKAAAKFLMANWALSSIVLISSRK